MSKNYWQIKKQAEQLPTGVGPTSRIEAYVETWKRRCYPVSIPDDLPDALLFSGRAPSWKAIAICLLNNDFKLHKLGYTTTPGEWARAALDLARSRQIAGVGEQLCFDFGCPNMRAKKGG